MCRQLEVSRSGFYAWACRSPSRHARRDAQLSRWIEEEFSGSGGVYGSPRIHALLRRRGERTGRKRVARLMRGLRLKARANRLYRRLPGAVMATLTIPNQARERAVTGPNQLWRGDVTYLRASGRWRYLAVVIDQFSRRLVGWQLGRHRTMDLTLGALDRAIARRRPASGLIFHSDRGNEYAAYAYRDRLERRGITQSMNRPKSMADNAHMESFFHSMKSELIHGQQFDRVTALDTAVRRYIDRYNRTRLHSALGYRSPIDYEQANAHKLAACVH
jgi:transposase InsO family protein